MDLTGKTIVVTGATSGLGQSAAIDFAKSGAKVFIVGRDAARAAETQRDAGGKTEVVIGDVSTKAGVKAVADAILAKTQSIDVLLNNAGGAMKTLSKTADGLESTFAINTFGAFLLEKRLHKAIAAAHGRVVNLTTGFLDNFPVNVDDLPDPKKFASMAQYGSAKNAVVMMSVEQAKRFEPEGIKVVSLHPGIIMGTRFAGPPKIVSMLFGPIMLAVGFAVSMEEAMRRFRVACFDDVPSGSYIAKGVPAPLPKQANDPAVRTSVMALLDKLAA